MNQISGLHELQQLSFGSSNVKIAVLDGPVDLAHPCFNTIGGKLAPWGPVDVQPSASSGLAIKHGTAVCSLIFGQPGSSVEGVSPGCSGLIIPIYSQDDNGNFSSASQVELAKSIIIAMEQGANIINISGGQFSKTGEPEIFLKDAIEKCRKAGILIVAAAGNEGCRCLHVPAAVQHVLAVGSLDENGAPTPQTNFGDSYLNNGILVQGKNLTAALPGGGTFQTSGGTSYATPIVSGVVGLLMSLQIKEGFEPDAYAIKSILEHTATPCIGDGKTDCRRFLRGKLNLPAAVAAIRSNPGVLASGLTFTPNNKIYSFEQPDATKAEAAQSVAHAQPLMVPADMSVEASGPTSNASAITQGMDGNLLGTTAVAAAQEPRAEALEMAAAASLGSAFETPNIAPSGKDNSTNITGESSPTTIENNLNKFNMENNFNDQNLNLAAAGASFNTADVLAPSGEIDPSDCGCGGSKAAPPSLVYALGSLGYDFGSESHRDSFIQSMGGGNPHDPAALLAYLSKNPWDAEELIWTLNIDQTPIYALIPNGQHGAVSFERFRSFLQDQQNGVIQRISVPGITQGSASLLNGQKVSNLYLRVRGMYAWTTEALVGAATTGAKGTPRALAENVGNFLNRIYYQMRNLGVSAEDRALNYAATNAFQVSSVFAAALKENLELNDISATKSPICRPGSDCYDVVLSFFNPKERLTQARKEYRFTIDVSDIVPVTVGEVRSWSVY